MKYTSEIVFKASESFSNKVQSDPALIRKRMRNEPKLTDCLRQYADVMSSEFRDEHVSSAVMSALVYGFMLREEMAEAERQANQEEETEDK